MSYDYKKNPNIGHVMITGGGGYVGARLVPSLLDLDYKVTVLDTFWYGMEVFDQSKQHPNLRLVEGDIRNIDNVREALLDCDAVIHLACISNDPSFDMMPNLGKSINFDCFEPLVNEARQSGVKRFIYASSSSVYGVKEEKDVMEDSSLEPLTDYSIYKAKCEDVLLPYCSDDFVATVVRPATVCGYSPRQRLDVVVNILTNLGFHKNKVTVFGGSQLRPNIHIDDMCRVYHLLLETDASKVNGQIFNAGYENHPVLELAEMVRDTIGEDLELIVSHSDDNRSYHISSKKISDVLGFVPAFTIKQAIEGLVEQFEKGNIPDSLDDAKYFNIKQMKKLGLA